jgi:hypothetical protein
MHTKLAVNGVLRFYKERRLIAGIAQLDAHK